MTSSFHLVFNHNNELVDITRDFKTHNRNSHTIVTITNGTTKSRIIDILNSIQLNTIISFKSGTYDLVDNDVWNSQYGISFASIDELNKMFDYDTVFNEQDEYIICTIKNVRYKGSLRSYKIITHSETTYMTKL